MSCGCAKKRVSAKTNDFCGSLKFHTPVFVPANSRYTRLVVRLPSGQQTLLGDAYSSSKCSPNTTGTQLARLVLLAWDAAISSGVDLYAALKRELGVDPGGGVQMLKMKEALYKIAGECGDCGGRGCRACKKTGLSSQRG